MSNSYEGIEFTEEELTNGYSAEEIFSSAENTGITFDDLISLPGAINFGVHEVDLTVKLTKNITLNHPLSSIFYQNNYDNENMKKLTRKN